ncbi:MAG: CpaF family protein, partial [Alphaproteobacteria bacterium]
MSMFGRRKIESVDDIVVALPTEGDEVSRPSRMAGAGPQPAAGREAKVVPLTLEGGGLAAAANIRSTPRGPDTIFDRDDTAESIGSSPKQSASAGADGKGGAFGRRRTDRIAAAAISAAAAKPDEPRVSAATTDRTASVDEAARMTQVNRNSIKSAKERVQPLLMDVMDVASAAKLPRGELAQQITDIVTELLGQLKLQLNMFEQRDLVTLIINDMIGLGPLEPLLADDSISEVMVNGPQRIYIERNGKLALSDVTFQSEQHVMNVATRIVTGVGRRVDESSPICDARLKDGSRVNVIVPPLAIDGTIITIRKFTKNKLGIDDLIALDTISLAGAQLLKVIAASRCNVLISGGTGSGKTTLLNCLTQFIEPGERVITCEDAAELQLQQPHVVRLETRPPNLEGAGEITMRDLVKNCLRMRPERIIVGEVRGSEAFDLLQAMNTGHDGSMGTVHANNPREAISRLENMIA